MLERLRRRRNEKGFTLIELLVVVIIIGLLAAIAIPAFLGQRNKANDAAAKSLVRNGATAMEAFFSDGNTYATATPTNLRTIEPNILVVDHGVRRRVRPGQGLRHLSAPTGYILTATSKSGTVYTYTKDLSATTGSTVSRDCTPTSACTANGTAGKW